MFPPVNQHRCGKPMETHHFSISRPFFLQKHGVFPAFPWGSSAILASVARPAVLRPGAASTGLRATRRGAHVWPWEGVKNLGSDKNLKKNMVNLQGDPEN